MNYTRKLCSKLYRIFQMNDRRILLKIQNFNVEIILKKKPELFLFSISQDKFAIKKSSRQVLEQNRRRMVPNLRS